MQPDRTPPLRITGAGLDALRRTRPWAFVVAGCQTAGVIAAGVFLFTFAAVFTAPNMPPGALIAVHMISLGAWVIEAAIAAAFVTFAFQYGRRLGSVLHANDPSALEAAFYAQRRFWTLAGALAIAAIAMWILAVIAAIAIPVIVGIHHAG